MTLDLRRIARSSTVVFLVGALALVSLSACYSEPWAKRMPVPDLVIDIEARLKSNPEIEWGDGCILSSSSGLPYHIGEITARIRNVGGGDAGSFTVQVNNAVVETVDGLKAGASTTLVVSTSAWSVYVAVVDPDSSIDELDESNNTAQTLLPVPTLWPPPTCPRKNSR